jgi:hypothetical protein
MRERRSAKRWRTVLKAQITFPIELGPIKCVARDLSDTGARLYMANSSRLPSEFFLEIPSKQLKVRSRLMWSRGANHGVMFLDQVKVWTDPLRAAA